MTATTCIVVASSPAADAFARAAHECADIRSIALTPSPRAVEQLARALKSAADTPTLVYIHGTSTRTPRAVCASARQRTTHRRGPIRAFRSKSFLTSSSVRRAHESCWRSTASLSLRRHERRRNGARPVVRGRPTGHPCAGGRGRDQPGISGGHTAQCLSLARPSRGRVLCTARPGIGLLGDRRALAAEAGAGAALWRWPLDSRRPTARPGEGILSDSDERTMEKSPPPPSGSRSPDGCSWSLAGRARFGTRRTGGRSIRPGSIAAIRRARCRVHYGRCSVFVPESHGIGSTGSHWWTRLARRTDDRLKLMTIDDGFRGVLEERQ